jgi:hypothetical protein
MKDVNFMQACALWYELSNLGLLIAGNFQAHLGHAEVGRNWEHIHKKMHDRRPIELDAGEDHFLVFELPPEKVSGSVNCRSNGCRNSSGRIGRHFTGILDAVGQRRSFPKGLNASQQSPFILLGSDYVKNQGKIIKPLIFLQHFESKKTKKTVDYMETVYNT